VVHVTLRREARHACVIVTDNGRGMSVEFMRTRLFKPFDSTKPDGMGLGMVEVRALAEEYGGTLDVDSRPGAGTRCVMRLPLAG
jgi:signal transduction histidine kinase